MAIHVGDLAKGPALGDFLDRVGQQRRTWLIVFASLFVVFIVVALLAPLVGLLLLAFLLMVGIAAALYSRKQVHGHGRLGHHRGRRR